MSQDSQDSWAKSHGLIGCVLPEIYPASAAGDDAEQLTQQRKRRASRVTLNTLKCRRLPSEHDEIDQLKLRIIELEEFNEHLKLENRMLREHGNGIMSDIQLAKAQRKGIE